MAVKTALDPVLDKASSAFDSARETARRARDTFDEGRSALPGLRRHTQKAFSDGVDQASDQIDNARSYVVDRVQERPFTATLAALGAGFVLGLLFAGHRR